MLSWGEAVAIKIPVGSDCTTGGSAVNDTSGEWNESVSVSNLGCARVDSDVRGVEEESGGESCCVTAADCGMYSGTFPAGATGTRCSFVVCVNGVGGTPSSSACIGPLLADARTEAVGEGELEGLVSLGGTLSSQAYTVVARSMRQSDLKLSPP
ncbi:hypothetical protein OXX79_005347 [Metschnikowia pulcherrima]